MRDTTARLPAEDQRQVIAAIAHRALHTVAPEELPVFDETATEFFADPVAAMSTDRRDQAVGFGLDLALVTPFLLSITSAVVGALAGMLRDAVTQEGAEALGAAVRRVLRLGRESGPSSPLSAEQARQLRQVALERARALGMDEDRAGTLADAVVGGMVVGT